MSMSSFMTVIIILLTLHVNAQDKVIKKDFNGDGVIDLIKVSEDGGTAFSSTDVNYTDGKTKKKYEFSTLYSFGSFFNICNVPNILGKSGRESLGKQLFGSIDTVDASLSWLIDACTNKKELKDLSPVDFTTYYTPRWIKGEPKIPTDYFAILSNVKYQGLLKKVEGSPDYDFAKMKSDYFWIDYKPSNHEAIVEIDSISHLSITGHGVILKAQQKYSWVFINDNKVFEANDKLRWPSIEEAQMFNQFVLIRQSVSSSGITNLFIVNPTTGFVVRLANEIIGLNSVEKIIVDKAKETVELSDMEGKNYLLTLAKIKELFKLIEKS
jgi:hypothetical protein